MAATQHIATLLLALAEIDGCRDGPQAAAWCDGASHILDLLLIAPSLALLLAQYSHAEMVETLGPEPCSLLERELVRLVRYGLVACGEDAALDMDR